MTIWFSSSAMGVAVGICGLQLIRNITTNPEVKERDHSLKSVYSDLKFSCTDSISRGGGAREERLQSFLEVESGPQSVNVSSEERWEVSSCSMASLYDLELISKTVLIILENSKMGARGVAHVEGIDQVDLKEDARYSNLLMINHTASPLSCSFLICLTRKFMECKDRKNHSALALPYSFLPAMTAKKLRDVAELVCYMLTKKERKATLADELLYDNHLGTYSERGN
ncbi:hypothetical protein Scep_001053 [Stephania cephalantha]|uniref:Uncharacterized protein n=1 Tax=Stephania cephalantha TaxID=152367 RepID=A0AAP0Q2Z5_9MAGN